MDNWGHYRLRLVESVARPMCVIYGLSDPRTNQLRYVGKTRQTLARRLGRHLSPSYLRALTHKNRWLRSLLRAGVHPVIEVLEVCASPLLLDEAERFHIAYWRMIGAHLTNGTDGGDGGRCGVQTEAHRAALLVAARRPRSSTWKARISVAKQGVPMSAAARQKMSASHQARRRTPWSEEHRLAISRGKGGRSVVDENGVIYLTLKAAARSLGLNVGHAWQCAHGKRKSAHGHVLRFVE